MIGACIYVAKKSLISSARAPNIEDLRDDAQSDKISLEKVMAESSKNSGPKPYFLKTRQYEWQAEYRFIWETNKPVSSHLDIVLPAYASIANSKRLRDRLTCHQLMQGTQRKRPARFFEQTMLMLPGKQEKRWHQIKLAPLRIAGPLILPNAMSAPSYPLLVKVRNGQSQL